jgi:hypothetical protein
MIFLYIFLFIFPTIITVDSYKYWTLNNHDASGKETVSVVDGILNEYRSSRFRSDGASDKLKNLQFLRNRTIVFFGDSITRYQYLYLINYLHHYPHWNDQYGQHLSDHTKYRGWMRFFQSLSPQFGCSLICDCRPLEDTRKDPMGFHTHESLYFYDEELDLFVHSIFWLSGCPIGTSFFQNRLPNATDFYEYCQNYLDLAPRYLNNTAKNRYDIGSFVGSVLTPSDHTTETGREEKKKIDAILLNYGAWRGPHTFFTQESGVDEFVKVIHQATSLMIWKTTSSRKSAPDGKHIDEDWWIDYLKEKPGVKVFDIYNATSEIRHLPGIMWDDLHFSAFVNRELTIAFLENLEKWFSEEKRGTTD